MVIPNHIQIENVSNICNAKCTMCNIKNWIRPKEIMSNEIFEKIINQLIPYKENIKFLTIQGTGEALIDKNLHSKIAFAKIKGFSGIGMPSNCELLTTHFSKKILDAGLDTLICSIDGITAQTHESIRIGLNYNTIVQNVLEFIKLRDENNYETKIIIRFVLQEKNKQEWASFKSFWDKKISKKYRDEVQFINVHNWGNKVSDVGTLLNKESFSQNIICEELYKRLVINADGSLAFCCVDDNKFFDLGSALTKNPIEIYNNHPIFINYRNKMEKGEILKLDNCSNCTVPIDRFLRTHKIGVYNEDI